MGMEFFQFEPKVNFRYLLKMNELAEYTCKAVTLPSIDNGDIIVDCINAKMRLKGVSIWNDITIQLYDPVTPASSNAVDKWIKQHHDSKDRIDLFAYDSYKKPITIEVCDPEGTAVEIWDISGAYIGEARYGDMDWSDESAKLVELTIRYDYAEVTFAPGKSS